MWSTGMLSGRWRESAAKLVCIVLTQPGLPNETMSEIKQKLKKPGVVPHAFNLGTREAEASRFAWSA